MKKVIVSIITLIAMLVSVLSSFTVAFADTRATVTTVFDLAGKNIGTEYSSAGYRYPKVTNADGTVEVYQAMAFRTKAIAKVVDVGGIPAIAYMAPADKAADTYINLCANNEQTSVAEGRIVYTARIYTTTSNSSATLVVGRKTSNEVSLDLWEADEIKPDTWYDFKYVIDLDRDYNNVIALLKEDTTVNPQVFHEVGTYLGESYSMTRADIDIYSENTEDYIAYADLKLTHTLNGAGVEAYTNGNSALTSFEDGIFSAETSASGLFAVALYNNLGDLVALNVAENKNELESIKLSMVLENTAGKTMKIFRFEDGGTPFMVNKELVPDNTNNIRIYTNETFDNNTSRYTTNGTTAKITDGRLEFVSRAGDKPRFNFPASKHGRYVIFEADYQLGTADVGTDPSQWSLRLLNNYYTNTSGKDSNLNVILRLRGDNEVYYGNQTNSSAKLGTLSAEEPTKISVKMDFEENKCSVYFNRQLAPNGENIPLMPNAMDFSTIYEGRSFFIGYSSDDNGACNLFVDNIRLYEGTEFKDLGNAIPNVHVTEFSEDEDNATVYERPSATELAKASFETGHPRVLINSDRVSEIKNSTDATVIEWRDKIIADADAALSTEPYNYNIRFGAVEDLEASIELMMNNGLAYQLTGDKKYADRAYKEALPLINYQTAYALADGSGTEYFNDWNSKSYLDVGEISFIIALCYDWMYDAWTPEQKQAMADAVMEKAIDISYTTLHNQKNVSDVALRANYSTDLGWYKSLSNWNAVCNGGVFTAAIAFMEEDPYKCSSVAEATMRGLEYMMTIYAPGGAWNEGPTYWAYALKYLTIAMSTMDAISGGCYGIENAEGFDKTALYSLSLEGKNGVVNFGDSGGEHVHVPYIFFLSRILNKPEYTSANLYAMKKFSFEPNAFSLIYYDPELPASDFDAPIAYYYPGSETVSFTSGLNTDNSFIAISGGKGKMSNHDHLDSGGVVVDMKGNRVFGDVGAEHYEAYGYFSTHRFHYFRARPESHNTFIINPSNILDSDGTTEYYGQNVNAVSTITDYNPNTLTATMNLDAAYSRDAETARRTISLDGEKVIITDNIGGLKAASDIYWNWYVQTKSANQNGVYSVYRGEINISADGKSAEIKILDKTYTVRFEVNADYTLAVEDAVQYVATEPENYYKRHSNEHYKRLVLKITGAADDVTVKTIIE